MSHANEEDDGIDLTKFDAIVDKSLSEGTLKIYNNKLKRIRDVLLVPDEHEAEGSDDDDSDSEDETERPRKIAKNIEDISARRLLKFIEEESEHASGESKTASVPEAYRNALMYYYRKNNITPIPVEIEVTLAKFIKGVRNEYAAGRRDGTHKATEGKDVLDFETYEQICFASMKDGNFNGHLYMILMWNMASRSDNAQALNYQSLKWSGDCITVTIEKSKAKQAGAMRRMYPRISSCIRSLRLCGVKFCKLPKCDHWYSNAKAADLRANPRTCIATIQGLYLLVLAAPPLSSPLCSCRRLSKSVVMPM